MQVTTIGLDLAKNVFQVHGVDAHERPVLRKRLSHAPRSRSSSRNFFPCRVGMEACPGAHWWARQLLQLGHDVKLMPPQYVRPYVKRNKNDATDAEAICEALTRPSMRFVPVKSLEQQAALLLHRTRGCDACDGSQAGSHLQSTRKLDFLRLSAGQVRRVVRMRTRNFGRSLAKYRAEAPVSVFAKKEPRCVEHKVDRVSSMDFNI